MTAAYTCSLCGFTAGRFRSWVHANMEWAWWRPFDKRPYHVRNRCVRWLPWALLKIGLPRRVVNWSELIEATRARLRQFLLARLAVERWSNVNGLDTGQCFHAGTARTVPYAATTIANIT